MDKNFDALVMSLSVLLASGKIGNVGAAIAQLEDLVAAAEVGTCKVWKDWRKNGGAIGDECLSVLARRTVLQRMLVEARATMYNIQSPLRIVRVRGSSTVDLTLTAVRGLSHREIAEALMSSLLVEGANYYYWMIDIYDDYCIYEQTERTLDYSGVSKLYRRDYTIGVDETVIFGTPTEVEKKITYVEAIQIEAGGTLRIVRQVQ